MDNYQSNPSCNCTRCRCRGLMGPAVLVTLGVLFLLAEFHVASFGRTWPILLIVIGLVKVLSGNMDTSGHIEGQGPPPPPPGPPPPAGAAAPNSESRQVENV
jgi:LiaI-LiaF-like transmembrane region